MDHTEELLKTLTEASGVPGYEEEVRRLLRTHLEPEAKIEHDRLRSMIARRPGRSDRPRVVLAAHMDEIGFMVRYITKEGCLKFVPLGGWWDQVLLGQRVIVKTYRGDIPGVIGAKPPHVLKEEERNKVVPKAEMYIDIGATSRAEAEAAGVRSGDPVVPASPFAVMASGRTYLAKALDDRVGCALVVEVLQGLAQEALPNALYGVATVQEEVGLRGAITSAHVVEPDVAIILEVDIAGDVPGIEEDENAIALGKGPVLLLYDAAMIPNLRLRDLVIAVAEEEGIPLQFSALTAGATDGGRIHIHGEGVPTVVLGVPTRHIHSHGAIMHRGDYDHALRLIQAVVRRLDAETVARLVP
ncbi:MAG: M42 family metallopeptidase [Anaerolineae bacterium]